MAIDTANKRLSVLDHEEPWAEAAPIPDGTLNQHDRWHALWSYRLLDLAVAAVTVLRSKVIQVGLAAKFGEQTVLITRPFGFAVIGIVESFDETLATQ